MQQHRTQVLLVAVVGVLWTGAAHAQEMQLVGMANNVGEHLPVKRSCASQASDDAVPRH